jgi:hypothetical protein
VTGSKTIYVYLLLSVVACCNIQNNNNTIELLVFIHSGRIDVSSALLLLPRDVYLLLALS